MADEIKLETRFSGSTAKWRYIAGGVAAAVIIGIVLVMTTGLAARLLPMDEQYLSVLIPTAADGSEALSLQTLEQESDGKMLSVKGTVFNRTESTISGLVAVIQVNDRFLLPSVTVQVPLDPAELEPNQTATFQTAVMLGEYGLSGYTVQFQLPDDGPFVPHRDQRPPTDAPGNNSQ